METHLVVEVDHREVGLRHDQVLVVARVRDQRLLARGQAALPDAGQVVSLLGLHALRRDRRTDLHAQSVGLVEVRRPGAAGSGAVQRVEIQARGPVLDHLGGGDLARELQRGGVHRQVVVDELAEVGVARGDPAVATSAGHHRPGQLPDDREIERGALGAHPGEPERDRFPRAQGPGGRSLRGVARVQRVRLVTGAATDLGDQESLPFDVEGLGPVLHVVPVLPVVSRHRSPSAETVSKPCGPGASGNTDRCSPAPPAPAVTTFAAGRVAATGLPATGLDLGLTSSGLVDRDSVHPRGDHARGADLGGVRGERVAVEYDEIGNLSGRDRAGVIAMVHPG